MFFHVRQFIPFVYAAASCMSFEYVWYSDVLFRNDYIRHTKASWQVATSGPELNKKRLVHFLGGVLKAALICIIIRTLGGMAAFLCLFAIWGYHILEHLSGAVRWDTSANLVAIIAAGQAVEIFTCALVFWLFSPSLGSKS